MIMSVSTLSIGSGAATPVNVVNFFIRLLFNFSAVPLPPVRQRARGSSRPMGYDPLCATWVQSPLGLPNGAVSGNALPNLDRGDQRVMQGEPTGNSFAKAPSRRKPMTEFLHPAPEQPSGKAADQPYLDTTAYGSGPDDSIT